MIKRAFLLVCLVILGAAPFISGSSLAAVTGEEKVKKRPSKEAWHNQSPACGVLPDCSPLPEANPYPKDTLHVAASGGQETARTYLAFTLPPGAVLDGGTLILPVDSNPDHGSLNPEDADFVACLTEPAFKEKRGSLEKPPEVNCDVRRGALYSKKDKSFEVDLSRFDDYWIGPKVALALLPSDKAKNGNETWHVVFPASDRKNEDAPEGDKKKERFITATFEYSLEAGGEDDPIGTEFEFDTGGGGGAPSSGGFGSSSVSSSGGSFDAGSSTSGSGLTEASAPTEVASTEGTQEVAFFAEGFAGPGFAYPLVWAMPLLILVAFTAVGRSLTKELYRAND